MKAYADAAAAQPRLHPLRRGPQVFPAEALKHLGAVNIGAAGTLVIRQPMTQADARVEVARKLPFVAEIVVCQGRDIAG